MNSTPMSTVEVLVMIVVIICLLAITLAIFFGRQEMPADDKPNWPKQFKK